MVRFLACLSAMLSVAACTIAPTAEQQVLAAEFQRTIPICVTDDDCERQWAAARRWVLDNSDYRIDIYTDDFIETFNSGDYASTNVWARVTKEPLDGNRYAIIVDIGCNNPFGCSGTGRLIERKIAFNEYVRSFSSARSEAGNGSGESE